MTLSNRFVNRIVTVLSTPHDPQLTYVSWKEERVRYSFYVKLVMLVVALSAIAIFIAEAPWGPD